MCRYGRKVVRLSVDHSRQVNSSLSMPSSRDAVLSPLYLSSGCRRFSGVLELVQGVVETKLQISRPYPDLGLAPVVGKKGRATGRLFLLFPLISKSK